jgi:hypothetical protein
MVSRNRKCNIAGEALADQLLQQRRIDYDTGAVSRAIQSM